uniref:Sushi domain-containing protein n=1 Tax=Esox lucius TaxID=8010 RepID=A0A3P8YBB6_ESOLU
MFWDQRTNMGSEVFYQCNFGYKNVGEGNVSHCNADGQWDKSALLCEAILCGDPPILPHTGQVWNGSTNPGSTVLYYCKEGFYRAGGGNISYCTEYGYWTNVTLSCKEVDCGSPPALPHSVMFWDQRTNMGSEVFYQCNFGYKNVGEGNVSHCMADGAWDQITFLCEEIDCGEPLFIPNTKMIWNRTSLIGSVVYYQCVEGYYNTSGINYTECGENGLWTDIKLQCEEVNCGPPLTLPHANMQWTNRTGLGSVIEYICKQGFYQAGGNSLSTCTPSGQWGIVSIICKGTVKISQNKANYIPLHFWSTALLFHCTSVPSHFCSTAILFHCTSVPLQLYSTALLFHCTSVPLHFCSTALLFHCNSIPLHVCVGDVDLHLLLVPEEGDAVFCIEHIHTFCVMVNHDH